LAQEFIKIGWESLRLGHELRTAEGRAIMMFNQGIRSCSIASVPKDGEALGSWRALSPEQSFRSTFEAGVMCSPRLQSRAAASGLEAIDIDASSRRRRASPAPPSEDSGDPKGRAFFDHSTRAEKYAQLIGRSSRLPRQSQGSLLEEGLLATAWESRQEGKGGDADDISTAASDDSKPGCSEPSLRVRRMLDSLLPRRGGPEIPLEVVGRLEHLVDLAERVESNRRLLSRVSQKSPCTSSESEAPAASRQDQTLEEKSARRVPDLLQKFEAMHQANAVSYPTLLGRGSQQGKKELLVSEPPAPQQPAALSDRSDSQATPTKNSAAALRAKMKERQAALRRKGFNALPQGGGRDAWQMIVPMTHR